MDETTIQDIRHRVTRWKKEWEDRKDGDRTWIFAVNIDDVELMLAEIERLEKENAALHLIVKGMRDMRLSLMEWKPNE